MFFLLYRHTNYVVIDDFPKISDHFPKIPKNLSEGRTNVAEHFPKISEDCRRLSKKTRTYTSEFKYNLRDNLDIRESIDILTSEDMENTPLESRMSLRMNFTSGVFSI